MPEHLRALAPGHFLEISSLHPPYPRGTCSGSRSCLAGRRWRWRRFAEFLEISSLYPPHPKGTCSGSRSSLAGRRWRWRRIADFPQRGKAGIGAMTNGFSLRRSWLPEGQTDEVEKEEKP